MGVRYVWCRWCLWLFFLLVCFFEVKCFYFLFLMSIQLFHVFSWVIILNLKCRSGSYFWVTWVTEKLISQYPPSVHNLFLPFLFWYKNMWLVSMDFICVRLLSCYVWNAFFLIVFYYDFDYYAVFTLHNRQRCNNELGLAIYSYTKPFYAIEKTQLRRFHMWTLTRILPDSAWEVKDFIARCTALTVDEHKLCKSLAQIS